MDAPRFDIKVRWARAAQLMEARGIDALFLMKPLSIKEGREC